MSKIKVKDFVGVSRETFSHAMRNAVEEAKKTVGTVESVEIAPPWHIALTDQGEIEFRTTVRILYSSDD